MSARYADEKTGRMQKATVLVSLLLLGWTWTLQGLPVLPEPLYPTQENFDITQFLGTWHDVAVASTCAYMQRNRADAAIGKLVLQRGATEGKVKTTKTGLRGGTCKEMTGDYELTDTPGRFFYHIERWGADVDAYVVHTNYNEYAIMIMSKAKSTGDKSTSLKLYSRTKTVRATVLEDFKRLVREQGMSDDTIVIKKDKGDCVPGQQVTVPTTRPEPQRVRRNVVPTLAAADVEGSGDDTPLFNGTVACRVSPDTGPCFGMKQRYYYNSTSMSCEIFKYGGCLGNQNNFESERECLQRCRTEAACRLPMAAQNCTGQPLIWVFDSSVGLCVPYKKGFCQGNGNKFYSKSECEEYCGVLKDGDIDGGKDGGKDALPPVACRVLPDIGPCQGMQQRYYYNVGSKSCEIFQYGGCLGNQNNFESEKECLQRCRTGGNDLHNSTLVN